MRLLMLAWECGNRALSRITLVTGILLLGGFSPLKAQDPSIEIIRGQRFVQFSTAAASPAAGDQAFYFLAQAVGFGVFEPISNSQVTGPIGSAHPLSRNASGDYQFQQNFVASADRDAAFPNGRYGFSATLNLIGATKAHAVLAATTVPGTPHIKNFDAAQHVDADSDFTLQWDAFTGAGDDDRISVQILDPASGSVVQEFTDLTRDNQDVTITGGELPKDKTLQVRLVFTHKDPAALPDAGELLSARSSAASETTMTLKTTGTSTGPTDTTPPQLVSTLPAVGETMISALESVVFQFSEPMNPVTPTIGWTALLNGQVITLASGAFQTFWADNNKQLIVIYNAAGGGWPAGASVSWTLNLLPGAAGNFRDAAGNELRPSIGGFLTAGGVDPCTSPSNPGELPGAAFFLSKQLNYLQTSIDDPTLDPILGALAFGFMDLPGTGLGTGVVTVKVPTANPHAFKLKVLAPIFGITDMSRRFYKETFASRSDLDDAYPTGSYELELRNQAVEVTNSVALQVSATGYPPIPHFSSFPATQAVDATHDTKLAWDPFAGATTNTEFISLNVYAPDGTLVFRAPDPCHGRTLAPDDAGTVIPANTLTNGVSYTAELSFSHLTDHDKMMSGVPGSGLASLTRITRVAVTTTGVQATAPTLKRIAFNASSGLVFEIAFTPGQPVIIESTPLLGGTFQTLLTTNPPVSPVTITLPTAASSASSAFFRIRTP